MAKRSVLWLAVLVGLAIVGASRPMPAAAQAAKPAKPAEPLQVQETNEPDIVAEFIECKRKEGVLTIRIRFRNRGTESPRFYLINNRDFDNWYVSAEDKKYLILRDEEGTPLAPPSDSGGSVGVSLRPKGTWLWWAKYPAPPPEVKKINYYTTVTGPFEDIPVTDQ